MKALEHQNTRTSITVGNHTSFLLTLGLLDEDGAFVVEDDSAPVDEGSVFVDDNNGFFGGFFNAVAALFAFTFNDAVFEDEIFFDDNLFKSVFALFFVFTVFFTADGFLEGGFSAASRADSSSESSLKSSRSDSSDSGDDDITACRPRWFFL